MSGVSFGPLQSRGRLASLERDVTRDRCDHSFFGHADDERSPTLVRLEDQTSLSS